jgi:hypothetical protein
MDDRCELYGDEWIKDYADAMGLPPAELGPVFERWLERYLFYWEFVMTDQDGQEKPPIERYLLSRPGEWREVARGRRAVLFSRAR